MGALGLCSWPLRSSSGRAWWRVGASVLSECGTWIPGTLCIRRSATFTREQSASSRSSAESLSVRQVFSTRSCSARMRVATTMSAATSTCSSSVSGAVTTFWRDSSRSRRRYAARSIRSYGTSRNSWRERVNGHRSS